MITRFLYPLSLRERISFKLHRFYSNLNDKNISLVFDKHVRLDLSKTDWGHKSIIFNGFYELALSRAIAKYGAEGGLLVDVGANYGYFSCLWASKNSLNKVLAFEASPVNIGPLKNNVNKNGFNDKITVVPIAAGKEKGNLKFTLGGNDEQTGWGGFVMDNDENSIDVEVDTLDSYCEKNNIEKIKVLKIDTEGADTWVLFGAEKLLREKKVEHIFFEHNAVRMRLLNIGENEAIDFLERLDYKVEQQSSTDFYAYPK